MLLTAALEKAGKQEILATFLKMSPTTLSRKINGEKGWYEKEINGLMDYAQVRIMNSFEARQIDTLLDTIQILLGKRK